MDINEFNSSYLLIEKEIKNHPERFDAAFLLNSDILRLLYLMNKKGKTLIPNMSLGELALCADEWDGYTVSKDIESVLSKKGKGSNSKLYRCDFLESDIQNKYDSIIVVPPLIEHTDKVRIRLDYLNKS